MTRASMAIKYQQTKSFLAGRPDWFIERFANLPTTSFMFFLVAYLSVRTQEHYVRTPGWVPSTEWLGFIVALAGGAITQWIKKRTTDHEYQRIQHHGRATEPSGEDDLPPARRRSDPPRDLP